MWLECGCRVESAALEAWQLTAIEPDLASNSQVVLAENYMGAMFGLCLG